jgi:hypothetical protein
MDNGATMTLPERADYSLTESALSPFPAEPVQNKEEHIRIKPVFDSHEEYSDLAKAVFDKFIVKNPRSAKVLLPLRYDSDVEVSALQIADTLAYEVRKYLSDKLLKPEKEPRTSFKRLLPTIHKLYRMDYEQLATIVAKQKPDMIPIEPIVDRKDAGYAKK